MDIISLILIVSALAIVSFAQFSISSAYSKYKQISLKKDISGWEVARTILDANGLEDLYIVETKGNLTDHYDPVNKVVRLSSDIYHGKTIAAASVAAHECGHAIQDKNNYTFLRIRSSIIPIVNLSSKLGYFAILLGFLFNMLDLALVGVALEVVILLFQLITLPVEIDASKRAKVELKKLKIVNSSELDGTDKMLKAAASTYVASVLSTLLEIIRLLLIIISQNDRD